MITTVADPLSTDLITMSLRLLSDLRACRSRTGSGFMLRTSCSTASMKAFSITDSHRWYFVSNISKTSGRVSSGV